MTEQNHTSEAFNDPSDTLGESGLVALDARAFETDAGIESELDAKDTEYADRLYDELGKIANQVLPDGTTNAILRHRWFKDWQFSTTQLHQRPARMLSRYTVSRFKVKPLELPESGRRQVKQQNGMVEIVAEDITGGDLLTLMDIQRDIKRQQVADGLGSQALAKAYAETSKMFTNEYDVFTEREAFALSRMTHEHSYAAIAGALGTKSETLHKMISRTFKRLGLAPGQGRFADVMVHAEAHGAANLDHILEGQTRLLGKEEQVFIANHYSDLVNHRQGDNKLSNADIDVRWRPITARLGVKRIEAIRFALKDGLIKLQNTTPEQSEDTDFRVQ